MLKIIGVLFVIWICWSFVKAKIRLSKSELNMEIGAETRHIAINELGVPQSYYNEILINREKWQYIRDYAACLKNNGNDIEAFFLKPDIRDININECSWARLLAIGIADLYKEEKPYLDLSEKLMAGVKVNKTRSNTLKHKESTEEFIDIENMEQSSQVKCSENSEEFENTENISIYKGIRLEDAEVDILAIVRNNNVVYFNDEAEHLFILDRDGDEKLDGRVVNFVFSGQEDSDVVEIFVAFDDSDSYTMFTLQSGMMDRLNYVTQAIFKYFSEANIQNVFSPIERYSTQYVYTFKVYRKNDMYFMTNNGQTQAYLIDKSGIMRDDIDGIKDIFWNEITTSPNFDDDIPF